MANADAINLTIASIRGEIESTKDVGFNMSDYVWVEPPEDADRTGRHCGTVACIAGHAAFASGADRESCMMEAFDIGRDFLGLTESEADRLFIWTNSDNQLSDIGPEEAIRTLEHLRDTGEVDWKA